MNHLVRPEKNERLNVKHGIKPFHAFIPKAENDMLLQNGRSSDLLPP